MAIQIILILLIAFLLYGVSFPTLLTILGIFFISYCYNLYASQEQILYQNARSKQQTVPNPPFMCSPSEYKLQFQKMFIKTADSKILSALYVPAHKLVNNVPFPIISSSVAAHVTASIKQYKTAQIDSDTGTDNSDSDSDIIDFVTPAAKVAATPFVNTNFLFSSPHVDSISPSSTYHLHELALNKDHHVSSEIPTLIWSHGNAGDILSRLPQLFSLVTGLGVNVLIYDYRGYGESSDVPPNEEGLILDAISTYLCVQSRPDINHNLVYLFGQSLGGAVTVALAAALEIADQKCKNADEVSSQEPPKLVNFKLGQKESELLDIVSPMLFNTPLPKGIILENTFTSISDLVNTFFPCLSPFKSILLRLRWNSLDRLRNHIQKTPALFLSSEQDEIIPPPMMGQLFKALPHNNQVRHIFPQARHNDAWIVGGLDYIHSIQRFLQHSAANTKVGMFDLNASSNIIFAPTSDEQTTSQSRIRDILIELTRSL